VAGALVAVGTYLRGVQKTRSENDIGYICCNERSMGIYVAKTPWYSLWPWAKAEVPVVPTFTGLFKAADANIWTSTLVDDLPDNINDELCWTQIFEEFFIDLAWKGYSAPDGSGAAKILKRAAKKCKGNVTATNVEIASSEPHRCYKHNRHDLYQPIHGQQATLRKCIRPLENLSPGKLSDPLRGPHSIWERNMRPIWTLS
jgi:hypothetical protein